jgi:lipid A 3-O-deacylase
VASLCVVALQAYAATAAETPPAPSQDLRGSEIQVFIENDSFGSTDQYYTNGIKIGGGVPADNLGGLFARPSNVLLDAITDGASNHLGLFFGQNIYTPRDISVTAPQPNDRPWAAWLYMGAVAQSVKEEKRPSGVMEGRLHTVEFDLGMVGPPALGRQVQTAWHKLVDAPEPQGWGNQIRAEPGFMLSYLHKRRYGERTGVQLVPHAGVTLGTIMTLARAGGIVRAGQNMTGFGPDSIEPGGAMLKNTRRENEANGRNLYEWFVFAGVDGRIIGHNIFLDGSLFQDGPSVQSRDTVYDFSVGFSLRWEALRVSVTRIKRSEEFTTPVGGGGKQRFYSVNVGMEF